MVECCHSVENGALAVRDKCGMLVFLSGFTHPPFASATQFPMDSGNSTPTLDATHLLEDAISFESQSVPEYPEGLVRAWRILLGACLLQLCAFGVMSSYGVFQHYFTVEWLQNSSASDISWIGSIQLFLELALGPIGGKLFDAGYFRVATVFGCSLFTSSFFMMSLAQPGRYYQMFLSQGVGTGLSLALIYTPTYAVVSYHFRNRRALAMGILAASTPLGGVIFTTKFMLNQLIHSAVGFRWAVRASAFTTLGCFILGNILICTPHQTPIELVKESTRAAVTEETEGSDTPSELCDIPYLLTLSCGFLLSLGTYFPPFYLQLYAATHGVPTSLVFYSLAILNVSCILGRLVPNYLADRFGIVNVYITCLVAQGAVTFAMLGCTSVIGLALFSICYGFFYGSTISLYLPLITELTSRESDMGTSIGIALVPVGIALMIGAPIGGAILGANYEWWKGITFASSTLFAAALMLVGVRQLTESKLNKTPKR